MTTETARKPWKRPPTLYNGTIETMVRVLRVLDTMHPVALVPDEISFLDYAVVHTGDFGGPESLHPGLPGRSRQIEVRRPLIADALACAALHRLVDVVGAEGPTRYRANDKSFNYLRGLCSAYGNATWQRAKWLAERHRERPTRELVALADTVGIDDGEYEGDDGEDPKATLARFEALNMIYESDMMRMEDLADSCGMLAAMMNWDGPVEDADGSLASGIEEIRTAAQAEMLKVRRDRAGLASVIVSLREETAASAG